jgi:hypothetical protein
VHAAEAWFQAAVAHQPAPLRDPFEQRHPVNRPLDELLRTLER